MSSEVPTLAAYVKGRDCCCPRCHTEFYGAVKTSEAAAYEKNTHHKVYRKGWSADCRGYRHCTNCGHLYVLSRTGKLRDMTPAERAWLNADPERVAIAKAAQERVVRRMAG